MAIRGVLLDIVYHFQYYSCPVQLTLSDNVVASTGVVAGADTPICSALTKLFDGGIGSHAGTVAGATYMHNTISIKNIK